MKGARSASLRKKLGNLVHRGVEGDEEVTVGKRLWLLCQNRIRPEPIKKFSSAIQTNKHIVKTTPTPALEDYAEVMLEEPSLYMEDWDSVPLIDSDDFDPGELDQGELDPAEYDDQYEVFYEDFETDAGELANVGSDEFYTSDIEAPPSNGVLESSEGDYFYADGQGNVIPVEKQAASEHQQDEWVSPHELEERGDFSEDWEEEIEGGLEGAEENAYVMYDEDWVFDPSIYPHE